MTNTNDDRPSKKHMRHILAQTIPDETLNIASSDDLVKTVAEYEEHSKKQHIKVTKILLDTLDDVAMENRHLDFNVVDLQETTKDDSYHKGILLDNEELGERLNDSTVPGRYDIEGLLGTGATGQVFAVHDNNFDRDIAVKFMHPDDAHDQRKLLRFIDEASITAKLAHPNILPVHDLDYTDGALIYFSMGRAEGSSLQHLLDKTDQQEQTPQVIRNINDRVRMMLHVCNAIAYAHSQGIVHNDIKPGNIMVGDYGEILVVDWGTATTPAQRAETEKRMLGTPIYMSPEQARRELSDERSDIYCLGSTLFHLLTLRYPCWDDNLEVFWQNKRNGIYQAPSTQERKQIPNALLDISEKAMAINPEDRYPSVDAMILDLEAHLQGQAVSAHQDTLLDIVKRIHKKEPRVIYAAVFGLAMIITAIAWLYYEKALEHTRWITNARIDFQEYSLKDLDTDWTAIKLPGWRTNHKQDLNTEESFKIENGKLQTTNDYSRLGCYNLSYNKPIPGNMRITWDYRADHDKQNLNCFIGGSNRNDSYMFHVGGYGEKNGVVLTKSDKTLDSSNLPFDLQKGKTYAFQLIKTDTYVSISINNKHILSYNDPDMLIGNEHQHFGFDFMYADTFIDNILVEYQPLPQKIQPITVAHHYFSNALYKEALEHYQKIRTVYADSDMAPVALYRIGRSYEELGDRKEAALRYKQFIQAYPNHSLRDHVVLQLANTQASLWEWDKLNTLINKYNLRNKPELIRRALFASIEHQLRAQLNNPQRAESDIPLYYRNRTLNSFLDDLTNALDQLEAFSESLAVPINYNRSSLISTISSHYEDIFTDHSFIYERLHKHKSIHLNTLISDNRYEEALKLYPENSANLYQTFDKYDELLALLIRDPKKVEGTTLAHGAFPAFDDAYKKAFPGDRAYQARILLSAGKHDEIIKNYKDQAREYLAALENKKRHHEMIAYFKEHGDIFSLLWQRIRVLAKLRRYKEAKSIARDFHSHVQIHYLEALRDFKKGDASAFDELLNNDLTRSKLHSYANIEVPLIMMADKGKEATIKQLKDNITWNTAHNLEERNLSIKYVLGLIDRETFIASNRNLDQYEFEKDSSARLLYAIRLELLGNKDAALKEYMSMRNTIELTRSYVVNSRISALRK